MGQADFIKRFRPNVGVVLFNDRAQVFYGRRVGGFADLGEGPDDYRWQFPQGGVDPDEDLAAAAFRELKEETGVFSARLLAMTPGWIAYAFPAGYKKKNWKGQRQKWAAMLFEGADDEIDLQADDHQEFDDWRWGELEEAPDLIVPFKREVYQDLVTGLLPLRDFLRARG
ncbi:RNA pyrophosphohydrolase [Hyphococcus flavus]|uniref:RNA pyrophosphohydrolase n=1 Tax=Hyphococcus flavus TaxID=1866326 RepID=A0AAF0CFY2_9PROT|nr:RNA pyrophosphohydrolase [Hyphococcus flavus]WDI32906.1 RNA pyrophosphohydrolase [Hyphococcus flavus]